MRIKCLAQGHYCRCQQIQTGDLTIDSLWSYPLSHNSSSIDMTGLEVPAGTTATAFLNLIRNKLNALPVGTFNSPPFINANGDLVIDFKDGVDITMEMSNGDGCPTPIRLNGTNCNGLNLTATKNVPTMTEWAFLAMIGLLMFAGVRFLRREQAPAAQAS